MAFLPIGTDNKRGTPKASLSQFAAPIPADETTHKSDGLLLYSLSEPKK